MILTTPDGFILAANPKAENIFGYSEEELREIGVSGIIDTKDTKLSVFLEERRLKGNASTELTFLRKNGEKFLGLVSSHNFIDENGNEKNTNVIRDLNELKKLKLALNESEDHKQNLFENMREGYAYCKMLFDENDNPDDWIYLQVNKAFGRLTGLKNITGKRVTEAIPGIKELEPELFEIYGKVSLTGKPEKFEFYFKPLKIWLNVSVYMPEKEHFVAVFDNITDRIKANEELKSSQDKYHNLFDNAQIGIFRATIKEPIIVEMNKKIPEMSGYSKEELLSSDHNDKFVNPEEIPEIMAEIMSKGFINDREMSIFTKSGEVRVALVSLKLYPDEGYFEGTVRDITDRKQLEEQLKKSLQEKDMIIKETHHRVKNNLMIISSLLNLQSRHIKDKETVDILMESQNRARSMALIHEKLYQSSDLKRIDFGEYIESLSKELFHTYAANPSIIKIKSNVEPISLDINTAIPLGLIVNEIVTNSLKHAFPEGQEGEINIDFHPNNNYYEFTVKDNGIGFPTDLDFQNTNSLGLQMITSLTDQIDGKIELNKGHGTEFKITFKEIKYKERIYET